MKSFYSLIGVLILLAVLSCVIYGSWLGYQLIARQWTILNYDWKAFLIIVATLLILCTLFLSATIRSYQKNQGIKSTGKVIAYNNFLNWYSELKNNSSQAPNADTFKEVKNQIMLWGNDPIVKQINLLHKNLNGDGKCTDEVIKKADHVFLEIRRELGYRTFRVDRNII